jgi:hypothetical protein
MCDCGEERESEEVLEFDERQCGGEESHKDLMGQRFSAFIKAEIRIDVMQSSP